MPYTKEEARLKIQKLVNDFRAHEATLEHAPEAQIENNFIRPLFRYLNWNTENEGLSHAHYEFKVQATNKKGLRPDYILNLDGRDVLVMDAKQVKYSMRDPRWLYQVYSYAYSTQNSKPSEKIDFAILTDFQEFIVLDCTLFAAKPEAVNNFRVLDWTYNDYIGKFDEMWDLLERSHVLNDSKERKSGLWSRYLSPQKVKANRISPDKAFLADMDDEKTGWRVLLAKDMKKRNPSADGELITAAVQLLIDRLVFIKALSDREVDRDYLGELAQTVESSGLSDDNAGWFKACRSIFDELNNFYNGSIFAPRPELENVSVSNKVVRSVITDLQPENSPYNFAVLPVEILGTIYERFLGRVVRTTEKQVKIEEKPEVRKAGGVYYTPQYIVEYIVQNTLGKLLEKCKSPADAAKLKILDPACGSGSFLLGAYSKLIEWHKDYFARVTQTSSLRHKNRDNFYVDESGQIRLTAKLKRDILKNNLFGVDIDPQAVEVTRFSLSLKALEDLREGELTEERTLFHQTVLPDLSANIKNGNSLIGMDYFGLFQPTAEELKAVRPFDWKSEFKEIMENGGFDAVIGNPPYVRQESLSDFKSYFQKVYDSYNSTSDLYVYFMEKGIKLINKHGYYSIIVSSSFLRANYGKQLRTVLLQNATLLQIVDFGGTAIFQDAKDTYVCIPLFSKQTQPEKVQICKASSDQTSELEGFVLQNSFSVPTTQLSSDAWSLDNPKKNAILKKMQSKGNGLLNYVDGRLFYGLKTGLNEAFEIEQDEYDHIIKTAPSCKKLIHRFLGGQDIRRFEITEKTRYLIVIPAGWTKQQTGKSDLSEKEAWKWLSNNYKPLADHLNKFNEAAKKRQDQGNYWWELRSCDYYDALDSAKIIYPDIAKSPRFYLDTSGIYIANTAYCLGVNDLFLLGILNSKLAWFAISQISIPFGVRAGEFRYRLIYQYMEKFPVRTTDFTNLAEKSQHDKMVSLVTQMLELHKSKAGAKTQSEQDVYERQIHAVDEQIDRLVYELYGLSEEEIRIVEGK